MKFTLSWLKTHLETNATVAEIVDAMTMAVVRRDPRQGKHSGP